MVVASVNGPAVYVGSAGGNCLVELEEVVAGDDENSAELGGDDKGK